MPSDIIGNLRVRGSYLQGVLQYSHSKILENTLLGFQRLAAIIHMLIYATLTLKAF